MSLKGLILAGGQSSRLGYDKYLIRWHGIPQYRYLMTLMEPFCAEVMISSNMPEHFNHDVKVLRDRIRGLGPIGGIETGFSYDPHSSWLTLPCDLPLVSQNTLNSLLENRRRGADITIGVNPETGHTESLVAIWEPEIRNRIQAHIQRREYALHKVVRESNCQRVPLDGRELTNVNSAPDYYYVRSQLPYNPIDRNFFALLESHAGTHSEVYLKLYQVSGIKEINTTISGIERKNEAEFLLLDDHEPVRLDLVISVENTPNPIQ